MVTLNYLIKDTNSFVVSFYGDAAINSTSRCFLEHIYLESVSNVAKLKSNCNAQKNKPHTIVHVGMYITFLALLSSYFQPHVSILSMLSGTRLYYICRIYGGILKTMLSFKVYLLTLK